MRLSLFTLIVVTFPLFASNSETWEIEGAGSTGDVWSNYSEAKPDFHPDGWLVNKLARLKGEEIMLKSSSGAMLRWVPTSQIGALYTVYQNIEHVSEVSASFYIIKGDTPNAAAGKHKGENVVFVNFAMLDLIGDDNAQWAALLGHELAHLKLSHGDKQSKLNIPISILKTIGDYVISDPLTNTASSLVLDGVTATFSRKDEKQADYMGVIWATEAHYDPFGAAHLHQRMTDRSADLSIPFLSTHPSGPDRVRELEALANRLTDKSS